MIDFSNFQTTTAIPEASSMIETFRAIGYSFESAIADIIDNSISAGAKNIWIDFEWKDTETWLSICDDGSGMNNEELIQAMRPGSKHPDLNREKQDLGRFGLGLKTASFSQCRQLSVVSKRDKYEPTYWSWNLDFVKKTGRWELIKYFPGDFNITTFNNLQSGTVVLWNNIDRIVSNFGNDRKSLEKFIKTMEIAKKHLAMVFHRYLANNKITIFFQQRKIEGWDPFLLTEASTQPFPEEPISNGVIKMKGFVLPHKSKLDEETFKKAEGVRGWNEHQGFYIYRNERLILAGDWLGMFRKEEHYKLARIMIDLPNSVDVEWQLDIMKSVARPPLLLKDQLKSYAVKVRNQAVEVYRHRGKRIKQFPGQQFTPLWVEHKRNQKWFFKINRDHPLVLNLKRQSDSESSKAIETMLRIIEETVPTKSIYIKESEESESLGKPFEGTGNELILTLMQQMVNNLIAEGRSLEDAKSIIKFIEPFDSYTHFIELLT